jgi:hypothetical protein
LAASEGVIDLLQEDKKMIKVQAANKVFIMGFFGYKVNLNGYYRLNIMPKMILKRCFTSFNQACCINP